MRRALCALLVALVLFWPTAAGAQETVPVNSPILQEEVDRLLEVMDFSSWQQALGQTHLKENAQDMVKRFASGDFSVDSQQVLGLVADALLAGVRDMMPTMAVIIIVAVLCGVLLKLREAVPGNVIEASEYACYLMAAIPLVLGFSNMVQVAREAIASMGEFSRTLFPTMLALLAALGGKASGSVFQPAVLSASSAFTAAIGDLLLPVLLICAALAVLNNLSARLQVRGIYSFLMTLCSWSIGVIFTVFLGILTVQGLAASAYDGVTIRTAKYAIDNFVPVVGGMFADTVDTLVGCSVIVKNAVGLAGLLTIAGLCIRPCLTLLAAVMAYTLCAAVLEPVADGRVVGALKDFSKVLVMLFVAVLSVGAMFFILASAVVSSGNMAAMFR